MPLAGPDFISTVRNHLSSSVFGVRWRQQSGNHTHGYWTAEGFAETVLHHTKRQGRILSYTNEIF